MADVFHKEKRSEIMSRIRSKDTLIERTVFKFLRKSRVYFRKHYTKIPGKPDLALPRKKKAIFIDGDFWHGYDYLKRKKRLPEYWRKKIAGNIKRDRKNRTMLKKSGWQILVIWEHDIEKCQTATMAKIVAFLAKKR